MDGHSLPWAYNWLEKLQICCKEGVGKGPNPRKGDQSGQQCLGGSIRQEITAAYFEARNEVA